MTNTMKYITALLLTALIALVFMATKADATGPVCEEYSKVYSCEEKEKVDVCHHTESAEHPWEDVKVDKDAWDEHTSAHSEHQNDFLITEESPCPPSGEEKDYCDSLEGIQKEDEDCPPAEEEPPVATDTPTPVEPTETPKVSVLPITGAQVLGLAGLGILGAAFGLSLYQTRRFFKRED